MDLIIVNYKSTDFLHTCLSSIYGTLNGYNVNIHVFDNASNDHVHNLKNDFPGINLVTHSSNIGFSRAVNRLLNETSDPYIVLLNPDTNVKEGFFDSIIPYMETNPDVGIAGPKVLDSDGCIQGSARSFPNFWSAFFGRRSLLTRLLPRNPITCAHILTHESDGETPMEVDWVSGACMVVRRQALEDVGLMDERFFLYWEDADWCRRMWKQGWKVVYFPEATVVHHVGQSSRKRIFRSEFNFHVSAYRLFSKYSQGIWTFLKPLVAFGLGIRFVIRSLVKALGL